MVTWPPGSASGSASKYEETPDAPPDSGSTSQRKKKAGGRRVDIAELKLPTAPAVSWVENADSTPLEDTSVENNDQGPEQPLADAGGRRQSAPRIPSALSRGSMTSRAFGTAAESKREKPKPNVLRDLFSGAHIDWDYDNGGQRTQILKYDVPKLANWGFLLLWKGTAVSRYTILRALIMSGITTAIALHTCKRDSDNIETNNCIPISPETTWLQFSQLVSFLLGFFVTVTLNRWWATRERLQHVMGKSVTICMLFQSYAVIEDAETDRVRRHMLRWFNLAFRLVFKMADDDLEDYSDLKQLRLVTDEEEEALLETENPTAQVYTWISYALRKVGQSGRLLVGQSNCGAHMNGELIAMRNAVDEIMAYVKCQVPYSYVHLLTVLTNLHLLFVLIYSSAAIGDGLNADPRNWERIFFGYVWMFFNQMIYSALLNMHSMLINPFGADSADFPKNTYIAQLEAATRAVMQMGKKRLPPTVETILNAPAPEPAKPAAAPLAIANGAAPVAKQDALAGGTSVTADAKLSPRAAAAGDAKR